MPRYKIDEIWDMEGETEEYSRNVDNIEAVGDYIIDWIEGWLDSSRENEYSITSVKTNYKTFAKVSIQLRPGITHHMNLKVIKFPARK
jgi:hypothetical protein